MFDDKYQKEALHREAMSTEYRIQNIKDIRRGQDTQEKSKKLVEKDRLEPVGHSGTSLPIEVQ